MGEEIIYQRAERISWCVLGEFSRVGMPEIRT